MNFSQQVANQPAFQQVDIVRKYHKYPEFRKQLRKIEKEYEHSLNMSLYSNLDHLQKYGVLKIHQHQKKQAQIVKQGVHFFLNFYAFKMTFPEQEGYKFFLLFIRIMDEKLRETPLSKYSIIYYHCLAESAFPFSFLNQTFKKLPLSYYAKLQTIYVVEPTFLVKNTIGLFDFGRLHKLFSKRLLFVNNLHQLGKLPQIQSSKVLNNLPELLQQQKTIKQEKALKQEKTLLKNTNIQKSTTQLALQNISNTALQKKQPYYQGIQLAAKNQKKDFLTVELENHVIIQLKQKLSSEGLPLPFMILLESLKSNQNDLCLEGLFRKSGSIQEEQQIIEELSRMETVAPLAKNYEFSGYAVAGVVKKFFTKLRTPIVPYEIYNQIMKIDVVQVTEEAVFVEKIMSQLPDLNRRVIYCLISFLKEQVITRKQANKMNNYNLSVCFCPCIFRSKQATLQDLMNSGKFAKILDILFCRFEEVCAKEISLKFSAKWTRKSKNSRGSKSSRGSKGSRSSKQNFSFQAKDSPTKLII